MNSTPRIVPVSACIPHEGVLPERVDRVIADIQNHGGVRDPLFAIRSPLNNHQWVIIDGMHRLAACQKLGLQTIPIDEINYNDPHVTVKGWDVVTQTRVHPETHLPRLFPQNSGFIIETHNWQDLQTVRSKIADRTIILAIADRDAALFSIRRQNADDFITHAIQATNLVDGIADHLSPEFVPDDISLDYFLEGKGASVIFRPRFSKQDIIQGITSNQLFPHKSTRHIISSVL